MVGSTDVTPIRASELADFVARARYEDLSEDAREALRVRVLDTLGFAIERARRFLEAGAYMIMVESEGITEEVESWRTEVPARFISELGLEKLMFEAAEPAVFQWYVKNHGPEVNLFVDHSQVVDLSVLRAGIWGPKSLWRRVVTYRP
ncbi:MAG TPA: phosphosulfolactate synthase [Longimicrobiaceae bacterium]|nr:phosphosulfolactate synthase [Longimicrobiaceae bacterium]